MIRPLLGCLLFAAACCASRAEDVRDVVRYEPPVTPNAVAAAMHAAGYGDWRWPRELSAHVAPDCARHGYPYHVRGDFDGDRRIDHAFWATLLPPHRGHRLLLLESSSGRLHVLDQQDGEERYLLPLERLARGDIVFDFHSSLSHHLAHDAPQALICWKSSRAWVRDGRGGYRELLTSD